MLGAVADQGTDPLPEVVRAMMAGVVKTHLREAIALLNAPRRSSGHEIAAAWEVLLGAKAPVDIAKGRSPGVEKLRELRVEVAAEVSRCARSRPFFAPGVVLFQVVQLPFAHKPTP